MAQQLRKLTVGLRIAVIQLNPQIGHVSETIARVNALISRIEKYKPDIVVFPEFALSGYNFHSRQQIEPYLNTAGQGPEWDLCQRISRQLSCVTVMGYPEKGDDRSEQVNYNSVIVVNSKGELAFNYRKSFLYQTDEEWGCSENPAGFQTFKLPFAKKARDSDGRLHDISIKSAVGICMDLSPYKFEAPFQDFEFSSFHAENATELILFPMAWLSSVSVTSSTENPSLRRKEIAESLKSLHLPMFGSQGDYHLDVNLLDGTSVKENPEVSARERALESSNAEETHIFKRLGQPDMSNLNYWILRFMPFLAYEDRKSWLMEGLLNPILSKIRGLRTSYMGGTCNKPWVFENRNAVAIMCNRCGVEDGSTVFAGTSSIFKFNGQHGDTEKSLDSSNSSVDVVGSLSEGYEGVLVRDVEFEVNR
ncbi:LAFA_0E03378g1_1 [Lachancea sp. 'fantastica']|nr:LAFA_0E03378g1_1 [Lachancea sp. 'fantastica']